MARSNTRDMGPDAECRLPRAWHHDRLQQIVTTIGERIGKRHLTPAQGASAELVGGLLIATAGFSGLPVSTTTSSRREWLGRWRGRAPGYSRVFVPIAIAWVATLPATMVLSGGLFWLFSAA